MPKLPPGPPAAWGSIPLVPVALAYGGGVLLADAWGYGNAWPWLAGAGILGLMAAVTAALPRPDRWWAVAGSGAVLLVAAALAGWRTQATHLPTQTAYFANHLQTDDLLEGTVTALRPATARLRAEVELHRLVRDSSTSLTIVGKVLVYLPPDEQSANLEVGDGIAFDAHPRALSGPRNPFTFDARAYWGRQGIYHQVFLRTPDDWRSLPSTGVHPRRYASRWRRGWFRTFQRHLSGDELAVAAALVMGKRDLLTEEIRSAYTDTGAVHVLAVSGLHVGIIYLLLQLLLTRFLRLDRTTAGRWVVALLSLAAVWAFALVSGFSTSVWRSALMFSILAAGRLAFRKTDVLNVLAAAALVILWFDPQQLFQVGFQLSFAAIIGIVLFTPYLERLLELPTRLLRSCWSAMAASTGAQLGTLPLSLYNFGQFPTYFLLSGTVVILSAFALMFSGLLHGAVASLAPGTALATATGNLVGGLAYVQNAFVFFFRELPGGLLRFPVFPWYYALLLAAGIGLLAAWFRWRHRIVGLLGVGCFLAALLGARAQVPGPDEAAGLVVYHRSRATLIDAIMPGGEAFAFGDELPARELPFVAGPHREHYRYDPLLTLPLAASDTALAQELNWAPPLLATPAGLLLVLDGETGVAINDPTGISHVLVTKDFRAVNFPLATEDLRGTLVVLDGSIPPYRFDEWRELSASRGFRLWITAEQGAWRWDF